MSQYVMTYCLACGARSDSDIGVDDAFDWNREHQDEHPGVEYRNLQFHMVENGEYYRIKRTEVAGFKVGDRALVVDLRDAYDWTEGTIVGFAIHGYQGIVADVRTPEQDALVSGYLDHIEQVPAGH